MNGIASVYCGEIYSRVCLFELCPSFYGTKMTTCVFWCQNRWHVGGVQYTFPNLQNRRWESIIFFFFSEKWKLDEGRIQCILKVACVFLWLSDFIPFPISKGWMFSSPGDRKGASLERDCEHLCSLETAHPTRSPPTTQHNMGTEPCFSLLSTDSGKQTEQSTLLP